MKKFAKVMALVMVVVMSLALLVACAPNSDPDKAEAALKKNGYMAGKAVAVIASLAVLNVKGVETAISGTKTVDGKIERVTIIYFNNSSSANDAWDNVKKYAEDNKDDKDIDWVFAKSGAMIYYGTNAAIKAAK